MSVTAADAVAITLLLEALFDLQPAERSRLLVDRSERRLRDAAAHLAGRARAQLGESVPTPEQFREAALRVEVG